MAQIIITAMASSDQAAILSDLYAKSGSRTAHKFQSLFRSLYDRLTDHPDIGSPRPEFDRNIRVGIVSPYIVVYRYAAENGSVTVLRILHDRRHITRRML